MIGTQDQTYVSRLRIRICLIFIGKNMNYKLGVHKEFDNYVNVKKIS